MRTACLQNGPGHELQKKSVMTEGNATGERDREMEEKRKCC